MTVQAEGNQTRFELPRRRPLSLISLAKLRSLFESRKLSGQASGILSFPSRTRRTENSPHVPHLPHLIAPSPALVDSTRRLTCSTRRLSFQFSREFSQKSASFEKYSALFEKYSASIGRKSAPRTNTFRRQLGVGKSAT